LLRRDRRTRRYLADHGDLDDALGAQLGSGLHFAVDEARCLASLDDAERAALQFATQQVSLALERFEMVVDAVGGADAEVFADLADRGRVALVLDALLDESEDLFLAFGQRLGH